MKEHISIYSHPRSGTHFLEAFIARNFYRGQNLSSNGAIYYGHWSNKILLESGEPYHQLFGSHFFPEEVKKKKRRIYIYRDGRAVISSIYRSKFYSTSWDGISFSEFLRKKIDWYGGLGREAYPDMNIVEHWYHHLNSWMNQPQDDLLIIRFEDLKRDPKTVYKSICKKFFPQEYLKLRLGINKKIDPIREKVGLSPNKATITSWQTLFSKEDEEFFISQLPSLEYLDQTK
ncbi:sulfotransferase domain-containing protein [Aureitalea marina]|uniref:Sulfotransferase domain-containing protein n=1 Tax=Aureitalea marina TaxID=930804 RepID=A0A2S7KMP1_9FLAO|nr:sulfotransferase domain-containing protein [Aureitalea marina]PQB03871.1 hypothetical protein BST85_02340 [Aureitalea marina]